MRKRLKKLIRLCLPVRRFVVPVPNSHWDERTRRRLVLSLRLQSWLASRKYRGQFGDLQSFCLFLGYPRSGHSLVGSLLDAHPEITIAHEVDVLGLIELGGFSRDQIYSLLLDNSREFARAGRSWSDYSYVVLGQYQGTFTTLRVIGDKKGGVSSDRLGRRIDLLERLRRRVGLDIKLIHHVRNPYDCISTMGLVRNLDTVRIDEIDRFFSMSEAVKRVQSTFPSENFFEQRHEDFVADPGAHLQRLCAFLGVDGGEDYRRDCASIVFSRPKVSRHEINWPGSLAETVAQRMKGYDFFDGYTFS